MKVIVTGGRDYRDRYVIDKVLKALHVTHIVHGGCRGADACAGYYANENKIKVTEYKPEWEELGLSAGPKRNTKMLRENKDATFVVAFPGGKGTKDCVKQAKMLGFTVLEIRE